MIPSTLQLELSALADALPRLQADRSEQKRGAARPGMLIRLGYDIQFEVAVATPVIALLDVHPSRRADLLEPDVMKIEPAVPVSQYIDSFGNICSRFTAQPGLTRLWNSTLISDCGEPEKHGLLACQSPVEQLPPETLQFLLPSRYCEVDLIAPIAADLFGDTSPGWGRVQAICDWVHQNVTFGYNYARSTKTALEVYTERRGVCRDFQHLAIAFCRAMNVPARYVTGYLGDIGVPPLPCPMDFSAWFEVYLSGQWWALDGRHNMPRIGRVMIANGRDAADVAITTSFGNSVLKKFQVVTDEVPQIAQAIAT